MKNNRIGCLNQEILLAVVINNPLKMKIEMIDIKPIYEFTPDQQQEEDHPPNVVLSPLKIVINALENNRILRLPVIVKSPGTLVIKGFQWNVFGLNS